MSVRMLEAASRFLARAIDEVTAKLIKRVRAETEREKRLDILSQIDALQHIEASIEGIIKGEISDAAE